MHVSTLALMLLMCAVSASDERVPYGLYSSVQHVTSCANRQERADIPYNINDKKNKGALGLVYTSITPEGFEIVALFLRLSLPSALIRHENEAFRKGSSNRRNLKTRQLYVSHSWTKKNIFENDVAAIIIEFPCPSQWLNRNPT